MKSNLTARRILGANAAFSTLCAIVFLLVPGMLAAVLIDTPPDWMPALLRAIGVGLVLFAVALVVAATDPMTGARTVVWFSYADFAWVAASAMLLIFGATALSQAGAILIGSVAAVVLALGTGQLLAARRIAPTASRVSVSLRDGELIAAVERDVSAPAAVVWSVMTDHPGYADVADNLSRVEVISGRALGMRRRCHDTAGRSWEETCDLYEEGRAYGFRVHTEAGDYPYPIARLGGIWSVEPRPGGARFRIRLLARPAGGAVSRALFGLLARRSFAPVLRDLADAWAARMEREAAGRPVPGAPARTA